MKLKNTTDFPDHFLRRMVAWVCREIDFPQSEIGEAAFRNRSRSGYSGHAYYGAMRIVASIGPGSSFPLPPDPQPGLGKLAVADRLEAVVAITGHEIAHLAQKLDGRLRTLKLARRTEIDARLRELQCVLAFRAKREQLLMEWREAPVEKPAKPAQSRQEKNEAKARAALDRWQRKLKLAQTKVRKCKAKVRRYERIAAKRGQSS